MSKRYGSKVQLYFLKNGDITYYVYGTRFFKKVGRKSEGITEKKCMEYRATLISEMRHGKDLTQKDINLLTFDKLASLYFDSLNKHDKRTRQTYDNHLRDIFKDSVISVIDDTFIDKLTKLKISEGCANASINSYIVLCTRIANFGVKREYIKYSPFKYIKKLKVNNKRKRYLSYAEKDTLLNDVSGDKVLNLFVRIAIETGGRFEALLCLQKKNINIYDEIIFMQDLKGSSTYPCYFQSSDTFHLVKQHLLSLNPNDYVISDSGKKKTKQQISIPLMKIIEQFNQGLDKKDTVNRAVVHTLRHTFASHKVIEEVSLEIVRDLMNHSSIKDTERYAHLMPDSGRKTKFNMMDG